MLDFISNLLSSIWGSITSLVSSFLSFLLYLFDLLVYQFSALLNYVEAVEFVLGSLFWMPAALAATVGLLIGLAVLERILGDFF